MAAFSVCLLAHNSERFIVFAIESALAQSFEDWEMLISDDASTDGTEEIVQKYLSDTRVRYIRHRNNLKQGGNWGFAINNTNAPLIATLHADDVWETDTLKRYFSAFSENEAIDLVWGTWLRTTESLQAMLHQPEPNSDRTYSGLQAMRHLFLTGRILPSAAAFRRRVAVLAGQPNRAYGMLCDRDWFLRVARVSRRGRSLSACLVKYRIHRASVTEEFTTNWKLIDKLDDFHNRIPELIGQLGDANAVIGAYKKGIAELYLRAAVGLWVARRDEEANQRMTQAINFNSRVLLRPRLLLKWLLFHAGRPGRWILGRTHGRNPSVTASVSNR